MAFKIAVLVLLALVVFLLFMILVGINAIHDMIDFTSKRLLGLDKRDLTERPPDP